RISAPIVDAAKSNFLIFPYVPSDGGLVNRALRLRALDRSCMVRFVCGRIGFFMPIAVAPSKMLFSKTLWRRGWDSNPKWDNRTRLSSSKILRRCEGTHPSLRLLH